MRTNKLKNWKKKQKQKKKLKRNATKSAKVQKEWH